MNGWGGEGGYHSDPLTSNILEYPQIIFSIMGTYCERVREEEANTVILGNKTSQELRMLSRSLSVY